MQHPNHKNEGEHHHRGMHGNEEHRHADHCQGGVGPPEDADLAFPVGERFRQRRANQVPDTVGGEERDKDFRRAHDPGAVVHHRTATHADGEDIENGQHTNNTPLVVMPDISQVFAHGGGARRHLDALFGGEEAERQHQERDHRQHGDPALETERFVIATNQVNQRHHQYRREHAARGRQHKAPGLQGDTLRRVVGDHPAQGAIRDVNHGIEQRQQRVGNGGIDHFAVEAEVRRGVGQHADNAERDSTEQYPRPEFTPAAAGAVSDQAHARVRNRIQRTCQQEHRADKPGRNAEDIGIEKHHVQHNVIEDDVAGGVTHAVANLLFY